VNLTWQTRHQLDPAVTLHFGSSQPLVPTVAASRRKVMKGTTFDPDLLQFRIGTTQKLIAKADLAFVKPDQQRAEMFPRPFRFGVSADDRLLLQMQLDLDKV
jgi:hypothetical protein